MSETRTHPRPAEPLDGCVPASLELHKTVLAELDRVLASRFFKNALRSRQFLEYIVRGKLQGRTEELKERTLGIELFQRSPNYHTGEDPVVRVQAGEVRRRLEQYYQGVPQPPVRIELPLGSYAPQFHSLASETAAKAEQITTVPLIEPRRGLGLRSRAFLLSIASLCVVLAAAAVLKYLNAKRDVPQPSAAEEFWRPALASPQPALICLAKPVLYRPALELYRRYSSTHPGDFNTEVKRSNRVLPLKPDTKLVWGEMIPYTDYGVALGDVEAAVAISAVLGRFSKPTQVRIGTQYSFEDLHQSPSVLVGAFNNRWTMQITSGLHFELVEENADFTIRERVPNGRTWHTQYEPTRHTGRDFAIVARLLDSNTGQFTVVAAGLVGSGTEAAGDFVSHRDFLEKTLHNLPAGWEKKNLEFVLQTDITDDVAGPPRVLAWYAW